MAFALTAFEAFPLSVGGAQPRRAIQRTVYHITGTSADVDLDIGDNSGTFWTAAAANTTYGSLASQALVEVQKIIAQAECPSYLYSPELDAYGVRAPAVEVLKFDSAVSAGGSATETLTVTGLRTTDTVLSVDQFVDGAGAAVGILSWGTAGAVAANDALSVTWNADPGAGARVRVAVSRASSALDAGEYSLSYQNDRPNYLLPAGAGLTAYTVFVDYLLVPNAFATVYTANVNS